MYSLHSLGWKSFQELCLTISRTILGQTVEAYLDSNDGGRDGAFSGRWTREGKEDLSGKFVIQCKHTSHNGYTLKMSDLAEEFPKIERLVEAGDCDIYILMTNAGLSGNQSKKIESRIKTLGVKDVRLFGSNWIIHQIRESKRLRMLVPRLYGLGDLSQILDERAYRQARAILDSLREELAKVVVTEAYRQAASALNNHSFVLLIGEPAAGKTTIASMLAMTAVDQWDASMLKLPTPEKVADHWNPDEPSQFFWIDDAFGVSQYEKSLVYGWNRIFPQVAAMLRQGAKIVMTSRDYIYNRARNDLKDSAFPLINESQVVIDVHKLSEDERKQILYNHLKLGRQPLNFRKQIKPFLESVATTEEFIPEIARRLAEPLFTKDLYLSEFHLKRFVINREQFLLEILKGLDAHSKAALALIYMRNDRLESPIVLHEQETPALERLSSTLGECITALESLNGSLVLKTNAEGDSFWRFKHPTIGDSYSKLLIKSPELLGIYLRGSSFDELSGQVTCGDMEIENAVVIPKSLFPTILEKIAAFDSTKGFKTQWMSEWRARSTIQRFLSWRCSKDFLSLYIRHQPDILDKVARPGLYLRTVSEVDLALRLHKVGLLPEDKRLIFIQTVSEYAIEGQDLYALESGSIQEIFSKREFSDLLESVKTRLLPRLDEVRKDHEMNYDSDEDAEEYASRLLDMCHTLTDKFGSDPKVAKIIEYEENLVNEWIDEKRNDEPKRDARTLGAVEQLNFAAGSRSIFDDIDR